MSAAGSDGRGVRHLAALRCFARALRGAEAARCPGPLQPASVCPALPRRTPVRREGRGAARWSVRASKQKELWRVPGSHGAFGMSRPEAQGLRSGGARFAVLMVVRLFVRLALRTDGLPFTR